MRDILRTFCIVSALIMFASTEIFALEYESVMRDPDFVPHVVEKLVRAYPKSKSARELDRSMRAMMENCGAITEQSLIEMDEDCKICCDRSEGEYGAGLACGCQVHEECMRDGIMTALSSGNHALVKKCFGCDKTMGAGEVSKFIDEDSIVSLQRLFARTHPNIAVCPSCDGGMAISPTKKDKSAFCIHCGNVFCFACRQSPHKGQSCEEATQNNDRLPFLASILESNEGKKGNYRMCGHCQNVIERLDGCNSMYCGKNAHDKIQIGPVDGKGCGKQLNWTNLETLSEYMRQAYPDWACANWRLLDRNFVFKDPDYFLNVVRHKDDGAGLHNAKLFNMDFFDSDFERIDLNSSLAENLVFANCNLSHTNFSYTTLKNVRFRLHSELQGADFSKARMTNCRFSRGVSLDGAIFDGTIFSQTTITTTAQLAAITNGGGNLSGLRFEGLELTTEDLQDHDLFNVQFRHMDLRAIDFSKLDLNKVTFHNCIMGRKQYKQLYAQGHRDFRKVVFAGRGFSRLSFYKANVEGADFRDVKNLSPRLVTKAHHWQEALYSDDTFEQFGFLKRRRIMRHSKKER